MDLELELPSESWKKNAEIIYDYTRLANEGIPTLPFGIRMLLKTSGIKNAVAILARSESGLFTEKTGKLWFEENRVILDILFSRLDSAASFVNMDQLSVALLWKEWFEKNFPEN